LTLRLACGAAAATAAAACLVAAIVPGLPFSVPTAWVGARSALCILGLMLLWLVPPIRKRFAAAVDRLPFRRG
jgi:hypothetical protein